MHFSIKTKLLHILRDIEPKHLHPLQCLNIQNEKDGLENTVFQ